MTERIDSKNVFIPIIILQFIKRLNNNFFKEKNNGLNIKLLILTIINKYSQKL